MIRLRAATGDDIPAVVAIEGQCFGDPWTPAAFRAHLASPTDVFIVAEVDGDMTGYAILRGSAGQGELLDIAVRPGGRRHGVGRRLLGAVLDHAERVGIGDVTLEVRRSNAAATALYRSHGFEQVGQRRGYYHSPREDAVVMRRVCAVARRSSLQPAAGRFARTAGPDLPSPANPILRQERP